MGVNTRKIDPDILRRNGDNHEIRTAQLSGIDRAMQPGRRSQVRRADLPCPVHTFDVGGDFRRRKVQSDRPMPLPEFRPRAAALHTQGRRRRS
jgi:hypothetical protein